MANFSDTHRAVVLESTACMKTCSETLLTRTLTAVRISISTRAGIHGSRFLPATGRSVRVMRCLVRMALVDCLARMEGEEAWPRRSDSTAAGLKTGGVEDTEGMDQTQTAATWTEAMAAMAGAVRMAETPATARMAWWGRREGTEEKESGYRPVPPSPMKNRL